MQLDSEQRRLLIELVATADAIWEPFRWRTYHAAVVYELRRRYRAAGLAWSSGAIASAARKEAQRALEYLAGAGLVEQVRSTGRTAIVRLTDRGEATARRLAGEITTLGHALERMRQIDGYVGTPGATTDGRVPESMLAGVAFGDEGIEHEAALVVLDLLPALVRGWIIARADTAGRAYYHISDAGRAVLAGDVELPRFDDADLPAADDAGSDAYVAAIEAARDRIGELSPSSAGELGEIPLPASMPVIGGEA